MGRAADEIDLAVAQLAIGRSTGKTSSSETSSPSSLKKPSSTAATAGKYEFEIRSGTASFIGAPDYNGD